jgi:hypothetical protein
MTTREDIRGWLREAQSVGATHMIVKWDDFDNEDYPVMVAVGENPREVAKKHSDRVMEVYAMHLDLEEQLAEHRAFHWEML